jgi:hypothetical protein
MELPNHLSPSVIELIIKATRDAYDQNRRNFDPSIGNTAMSYGVSVWQSLDFNLERAFGSVIGAEVYRNGCQFSIKLPTCRLSFYKFGSNMQEDPSAFRLNGKRSKTRKRIVKSNQLSLFFLANDISEEETPVPELVAIHSGNAFQGFLQMHVGAPISEKRNEKGWLWLEPIYTKAPAIEGILASEQPASTTPRFDEMPAPNVNIEALQKLDDTKESEDQSTA